ncbi:MAG: CvpA family protein [Planctomycetota bacterium]
MSSDSKPAPREPVQMGLVARLFWLIAFMGLATYAGSLRDYPLTAVLIATGLGAFWGFWVGALRMVRSLAGFVLAVLFAPTLGFALDPYLAQVAGTMGMTNRLLSIAVAGVGIILALTLVTSIVSSALFRAAPTLERGNRWLGFAIGGGQAAVAGLLLFAGLTASAPMVKRAVATGGQQGLVGQFLTRAQSVDAMVQESRLKPLVDQINPFAGGSLAEVEGLQKKIAAARDPAKMRQILQHPAMVKLQNDPVIRDAANQLRSNQAVQEVLQGNEPLTMGKVMTLMNSPEVMKLLDQPKFRERLQKATQDVMPAILR